jgi:hypothetical protein
MLLLIIAIILLIVAIAGGTIVDPRSSCQSELSRS